jgi:hypothetical protein
MSTTTKQQPHASFGVTKNEIPGVLARAHTMYLAFVAAAAAFVALPIGMDAFLALIQALESAQKAMARGKSLAGARNSKRNDLWTAMLSLRTYVQGLAAAATHDDAIKIILAAGLLVAKVGGHQKPVLQAMLTTTQGRVLLKANRKLLIGTKGRSRSITFRWQVSTDGGKTWTSLEATPYASTEATGLALMTEHRFRVSVVIGKTPGDWSEEVKLLVH